VEQEFTQRQKQIKQQFIDDRGKWKWNDLWQTILLLDEEIIQAYSTFSSVPIKKGHLDLKTQKYIYIAIDAISGSLYLPGLKSHTKHALESGVTPKEIMEVLEITSTLGSTTFARGIPLLVEILQNRGERISDIELTDSRKKLKDDYIKNHQGYWSDEMENILKLDPEYFEAFTAYEDTPWKIGVLKPKVKELIYIAVHAVMVTLNEPELKCHIGKAMDYGATREDIIAVFEMVSCLGVHSITAGVPILKEAMAEVGQK